jgi:hypothetical protein
MTRCASFVHSPHHALAWSRCPRPAQLGDILCPAHRDALDGLVMGILEMNLSNHVNQQRKASRENGEFLAVKTPRIDFLACEPFIHPAKRTSRKRRRTRQRSAATKTIGTIELAVEALPEETNPDRSSSSQAGV